MVWDPNGKGSMPELKPSTSPSNTMTGDALAEYQNKRLRDAAEKAKAKGQDAFPDSLPFNETMEGDDFEHGKD